MDINKVIAENPTAWMTNAPGLDTLKKLSQRSGVGFGTVHRARNGDGNITVQNLEAIASAFNRSAIDLITKIGDNYVAVEAKAYPGASENVKPFSRPDPQEAALRELLALAESMNDQGRWQLLGQAKLLASTYPKAKANPAS